MNSLNEKIEEQLVKDVPEIAGCEEWRRLQVIVLGLGFSEITLGDLSNSQDGELFLQGRVKYDYNRARVKVILELAAQLAVIANDFINQKA